MPNDANGANAATDAAKGALLPSTQSMRHMFAAGASVFGGLALSNYAGMKVGPHVQKLLGGRELPVITGTTVARAATFVVLAFTHGLTKETRFGKAGFKGIEVRSLLFYATAAAFANTVGSLLLDVLNKWGGSSKTAARTGQFISLMTGLSAGGAGSGEAEPAPAAA